MSDNFYWSFQDNKEVQRGQRVTVRIREIKKCVQEGERLIDDDKMCQTTRGKLHCKEAQ